jgi:hypothetical protein
VQIHLYLIAIINAYLLVGDIEFFQQQRKIARRLAGQMGKYADGFHNSST